MRLPREALLLTNFAVVMPETKSEDLEALVEVFGSFLYPLVLALPLPVCISVGVAEREAGLRGLMISMGLPPRTYHAGAFAFHVLLVGALSLVLGGGGALAGVRFFSETSVSTVLRMTAVSRPAA